MNEKTSKSNTASSKIVATTSSDTIYSRKRITQNFLLIWLDVNIDQSNKDSQNTLLQLQSVVDDIHIFT